MNNLALSYWQHDAMSHRYIWSSSDTRAVFKRNLYQSLISSDALQRLADIRFLGAIDYFIHPNGRQLNRRRHNRLEHTLGVANLALRYAQWADLNELDEMLLVSAALLHDVGHSPLSHSLEAAFKLNFGVDHHEAGVDIVLSRVPSGLGSSIFKYLRAANIDPERVIELAAGKSSEKFNFLFSHPINIDTMEAISRSETYIKSSRTSPSPEDILQTLVDGNAPPEQLDNFWELKDKIYRLLIQGPVGLLADYVARNYVETNLDKFSAADYFKSERELRRSSPGLFAALEATRNNIKYSISNVFSENAQPVLFTARRFIIDPLKESREPERYCQSKAPKSVKLNDLISQSIRVRTDINMFEFE